MNENLGYRMRNVYDNDGSLGFLPLLIPLVTAAMTIGATELAKEKQRKAEKKEAKRAKAAEEKAAKETQKLIAQANEQAAKEAEEAKKNEIPLWMIIGGVAVGAGIIVYLKKD